MATLPRNIGRAEAAAKYYPLTHCFGASLEKSADTVKGGFSDLNWGGFPDTNTCNSYVHCLSDGEMVTKLASGD